jgi:predicted methyltransferase
VVQSRFTNRLVRGYGVSTIVQSVSHSRSACATVLRRLKEAGIVNVEESKIKLWRRGSRSWPQMP